MREKLVLLLLVGSVIINLMCGWFYLKSHIYQMGFNQGRQVATNEVQRMISAGQLIVPKGK